MILLAPQFLFGLLAIAIPVIIHFVQLRRPKKVFFTNVGFIKKVEKVNASQRKLKHWLILLSRILFLTFLVLLFCEPFIPAHDTAFKKLDEVKLYLDNSWSMQNAAEAGNHSLLDRASDEVLKVIPNFPAQTKIQLLDNSFKATSNRDFTRDNLPQLIGNLTYSPLTRSTASILSRMNIGPGHSSAYLFSDFQKAGFQPNFLNEIDTVSALNLVVIKAAGKANVFVDSVALQDELVRPNETNKLLVEVFNTGEEAKNGVNLKLFIGKQLASTVSIDLKPKSKVATQIDFRVPQAGILPCRLELEDQPVTFDNTYYFTLKTASPIRILDISGNSNSFTSRLFVNEPLFKYQQVSAGTLNYGLLAGADLVLMNELESPDAALTDNLRKFVTAGGNMVLVPAEKVNAESYGKFFTSFGLPVKLNNSGSSPSTLAQPDLKNPFFRSIFNELDNRMQMPAAPQTLTWNRVDAEILKYRNGNNFLSKFRQGKGNVYVFAAPFSVESNAFSRNALFVPVLYKLALSSYQQEQQLAYNFKQ